MPFHKLGSIRILLIDDEKQMLRLVTDVLTHLGFKSIMALQDGHKAIELLKKQPFDFVITDWRMPALEGIEIVNFIRKSPNCVCPHVPIIMLTGNAEPPYVFQARDAGVNEYLAKPFSATQLARRIRAIIEKPRSFIETPLYHGPNRRWHDVAPAGHDRRKRGKTIGGRT